MVKINFKGIIEWIKKRRVLILGALFVIGLLFILFQKSCGGGYESRRYSELKGQFEAYKKTAEEKEKQLKAMEKIVKEENASLHKNIDKLEIEKGLALAGTGEANKKIVEKELEIKDLKKQAAGITDLNELVVNLRAQVKAAEDGFSLALGDRDGYKLALDKANLQINDLNTIISNKDILNAKLNTTLAAEIVARKACEGAIKVGEKNTFLFKLGKLAGNGFKLYGIYSAGRDIIGASK